MTDRRKYWEGAVSEALYGADIAEFNEGQVSLIAQWLSGTADAEADGSAHERLTKREEFAKAAMQGYLSNPHYTGTDLSYIRDLSYKHADVMLNMATVE